MKINQSYYFIATLWTFSEISSQALKKKNLDSYLTEEISTNTCLFQGDLYSILKWHIPLFYLVIYLIAQIKDKGTKE